MRTPISSGPIMRAALILIAAGVTTTGCDSTARIFLDLVQFDRMQILGLTPVKETAQGSGVYVPACDGTATRVRMNFNLISTARNQVEGQSSDRDVQIRPGDAINKQVVQEGKTLSASTFSMEFSCATAHDGDQTAGTGCDVQTPSASVEGLSFIDNLIGGSRRTPVGLALLIDQSGSTSGTGVDGSKIDGKETCLEAAASKADSPTDLSVCASDQPGLRLTAAKDVIALLNDEDPSVVFAFSEEHDPPVWIACNIPNIDSPDENKKGSECYTQRRALSIGGVDSSSGVQLDSALDGTGGLQGGGKGRSNLWSGVDKTFTYMTSPQINQRVKHIIVVTDGPDTCTDDSTDFQFCYDFELLEEGPKPQSPCPAAVDFATTRASIEAYLQMKATSGQPNDLHVSFIHFQSKGYPNHDPRMMEIACMTGGHYKFLNFNKIAANSDERKKAIQDAAAGIRYAMGGYWAATFDTTPLTQDGNTDAFLVRGASHSFAGVLTMKANDMVPQDRTQEFGFGEANRDSRVTVVKGCRSDTDCMGAGGDCGVRCDPESRLCAGATDGATCQANAGNCCGGDCKTDLPGGTCTPALGGGDFSCP